MLLAFLILFLFLIVMGKWILFFIFSPIIFLYNNRRRCKIRTTSIISDSHKKKSNYGSMIVTFKRYFQGYLRFMDFQIGLIPSHSIRKFLFKNIFGVQMGNKSILYWGSEIRAHYNLKIGEGSIIGDRATLDARNGIIIGKNVNFSSNVKIWTEQHDYQDPFFRCNSDESFKVIIDDRVWIGPDVTILHSVHIGEGAVIAAGAVVTKDIPPFSLAVGIPAKVIGNRTHDLKYEFSEDPLPFY